VPSYRFVVFSADRGLPADFWFAVYRFCSRGESKVMKRATGTVGVVGTILKDASPINYLGPPPTIIVLP
jgi:hypothetical protein